MKTPHIVGAGGSGQHATPEQLVDALNNVFGKQQSGVRAIHAKGVDLEGEFRPADFASSVCKAPHLQNRSVPISVRFSDFTGIPNISDTDGQASPRGMSIKFHLPDGSETDIVAHSFNGFPTATTDEFRDFLVALGSSGPGAAKPTQLDKFLAPIRLPETFLESQIPDPVQLRHRFLLWREHVQVHQREREGDIRTVPDSARDRRPVVVQGRKMPKQIRTISPRKSANGSPGPRSGSSCFWRSRRKETIWTIHPLPGRNRAKRWSWDRSRLSGWWPTMLPPNVSCSSSREPCPPESSPRTR